MKRAGHHERNNGRVNMSRQIKLTATQEAMLGIVPDTKLAREVGCSILTIRIMRITLGIPPFRDNSGSRWTPEATALLGKIPDIDLAKQLGCTRERVRQVRVEHNIAPPARRKRKQMPVNLDGAGKLTDREIAEREGVSCSLIQKRRTDAGIPRVPKPRTAPIWEVIQYVGQIPDAHICQMVGAHPSRLAQIRKLHPELNLPKGPDGRSAEWRKRPCSGGWICPRCGVSNAPHVNQCTCVAPSVTCPACGKTFPTQAEYDEHGCGATDGKHSWKCDACGLLFKTKREVNEHDCEEAVYVPGPNFHSAATDGTTHWICPDCNQVANRWHECPEAKP